MDLASRRYLIYVSQHVSQSEPLSPVTSPGGSFFHPHQHSSSTSFPIIAIAIIGIMATAFLLVSYYIFVIKCCLNWHRIDILRRFSPSRRREDPSPMYSPGTEARGLDEAMIRLIPVIQYKTRGDDRESGECAVCLNEFQEEEKLRIIPNCSHVFHIDCIDVWLQSNANCPLCRTSISLTSRFHVEQLLALRSSSPPDQTPPRENLIGRDEDFVVIELGNIHDRSQNLQERGNGLELPSPTSVMRSCTPRKLEQGNVQKKAMKLHKVTSMGDECIDIRAKDKQFSVQPIRRSFSMDSSGDRQFYLAVQEALRLQNRQVNEVSTTEGCSGGGGSNRVKRSFFSFGHGSRSRSSVQPVSLEP
ncbi:RING-H2 finger protein ATL16 [Vigna unguiculata]|uniref:RING-type E3 ubiquitin transferase n=1 Tax=Vigna unguiculata TaxID=3917 RepID=A0A4D6N593_VIGUN|nr:RING-H2 finger protein ATL16 [Vigna unguiculata]QCE07659.1 nucleolysin TIA-1/TIAR [Vigna unguiculata]